jgi:hypothetical protein
MRPRCGRILPGVLLLALLLSATANARTHHHRSHHPRRHAQHASTGPLPSMGAEPSPSIFGLNTDLYDSNHSLFLKDIPNARSLGGRWDRFTAGPNTAAGNFGVVDWEVRQARQNGMGVILSLAGIPGACSIRPLPSPVNACPPTTAQDLSAYQAYVRRLVLHYRNVVDYYESWVEPNNKSNWIGGANPAGYAALLTAEYQVIQSVNSQYGLHIKLLFGSMIGFSVIPGSNPGWIAVLPFTERVLDDLHGQRAFDAVALEAYRFPPATEGPLNLAWDYVGGVPTNGAPSPFLAEGCLTSPWCQMTWAGELRAYEQEFSDHGYGQPPMWLTEFGWPGNAQPVGDYFPDEALQATYMTEAYAQLLLLPFVQGALWFTVRDYQPGYSSPDPAFFYHYGLFEYGDTLKPAATVFKTLAAANPNR